MQPQPERPEGALGRPRLIKNVQRDGTEQR
jgi:hypothetical protein